MVTLAAIPPRLDEPVVVIDVLRAFTTAAWVLHADASALLLAASRADALSVKAALGPDAVAVADGELAPGFDLGNSPAQAQRFELAGRPVVQTTTNGTVGVHAARHAPLVLCAGLVTAAATARALVASGADAVTYVVTGGETADEDVACADLIDALANGRQAPRDTVDRVQGSRAAAGLRSGVAAGFAGVDEDDIRLSCEIDRFAFTLGVRPDAPDVELVRICPDN